MDHRLDYLSRYPSGQPGGIISHRGHIVGIELIVFATVFTLIVLLTGGPSNGI